MFCSLHFSASTIWNCFSRRPLGWGQLHDYLLTGHLQRRLKPMEHLSRHRFWYLSIHPDQVVQSWVKITWNCLKFEFRYENLKRQIQFNVFVVNKFMIGCRPWREQTKSSKKHRLNLNPRFELIGLPSKEHWYIQIEIPREGAALNPFRSFNLFNFSPDRVYVFVFRCKFVIRDQHWGERDVTSDKKCDEYCRCHIQNSPSDLPTPPPPPSYQEEIQVNTLGILINATPPLDVSCKDDVVFVFLADLGALVEVFLLLTASQIKKHWLNYLVKKTQSTVFKTDTSV